MFVQCTVAPQRGLLVPQHPTVLHSFLAPSLLPLPRWGETESSMESLSALVFYFPSGVAALGDQCGPPITDSLSIPRSMRETPKDAPCFVDMLPSPGGGEQHGSRLTGLSNPSCVVSDTPLNATECLKGNSVLLQSGGSACFSAPVVFFVAHHQHAAVLQM